MNPRPETRDLSSLKQTIHDAAAIFLDWDGCVMMGNTLVPAAQTLLDRHADRIVILSNNSTHLPEDFSRVLHQADVCLPSERILLAGVEALQQAAQHENARIMLVGSLRIKCHARQMGLNLVREDPDIVLLMRDTRFTYAKLCRAINALRRGAKLIVANGDLTHPDTDDRLVPETGALLAAFLACVPEAPVVTIGKPSPLMFARACEVADVSPSQVVMIGDNPATDGKGALDYGIRPILIGSQTGLSLDDLIDS
ncbi:HAD family hydrolase [Sphingobium sp. SCG-1]|nr:HAD family hydrolase [Sphingobium sp. SCG-1]AUW59260.1 HAD family hydrolase [Sphingobium sp. SCG-1]